MLRPLLVLALIMRIAGSHFLGPADRREIAGLPSSLNVCVASSVVAVLTQRDSNDARSACSTFFSDETVKKPLACGLGRGRRGDTPLRASERGNILLFIFPLSGKEAKLFFSSCCARSV